MCRQSFGALPELEIAGQSSCSSIRCSTRTWSWPGEHAPDSGTTSCLLCIRVQAAMHSTRLPDHALHHGSFYCVQRICSSLACTRVCELDLQVSMRTLSDSELAIAVYPTFSYNSLGGGGVASAREEGSIVHITFDPSTLTIPDVNYRNTTFMGVPMAPPFSIAVKPKKLEVRGFTPSFITTSTKLHPLPHFHYCGQQQHHRVWLQNYLVNHRKDKLSTNCVS